jgi:hypothetical protein
MSLVNRSSSGLKYFGVPNRKKLRLNSHIFARPPFVNPSLGFFLPGIRVTGSLSRHPVRVSGVEIRN